MRKFYFRTAKAELLHSIGQEVFYIITVAPIKYIVVIVFCLVFRYDVSITLLEAVMTSENLIVEYVDVVKQGLA